MEIALGQELRARILATAADTDGRHDFVDATMRPDAATPLHVHTRYAERFWVLEGTLIAWAGVERRVLTRGDYLCVPRNTVHALRAGPEGGRALQISSPAGFTELLRRVGVEAHLADDRTRVDPELFATVARELGDEILGPPGTVPDLWSG